AYPDPSVYRAMIVLTDGEPNGTGPANTRANEGFVDDRWNYRQVGYQRGTSQVIEAAKASTNLAWNNDEVHTWVVSYKANSSWMEEVAQGDGAFVHASSSEDLVPIFADIAESLPTMLVQ
ncbi:MAG: hypothetical protein AAF211_32710, partial [Myxococcota bacterium]